MRLVRAEGVRVALFPSEVSIERYWNCKRARCISTFWYYICNGLDVCTASLRYIDIIGVPVLIIFIVILC